MKRLWLVLGVVVPIGAIAVTIMLLAPKNPIPGPLRAELTSTLFVPSGPEVAVDRSSAKYDKTTKLLSFTVAYAGAQLVISEQPTPSQFTDIPDVYTKLVDGLNNYESFDVSVGTVHLTKPKQLGGKEAAVLNAQGTLMFVKADVDRTSDQWRIFFNHIEASSK